MRALLLMAALLLAPLAAAALPAPAFVHAAGFVTLDVRGIVCESPVDMHADLIGGTGTVSFGPSDCALFAVFPFALGTCHDMCAGECRHVGGGDVLCFIGDEDHPEESGWYARLAADGAFEATFYDWRAAGTLERASA